MCKVAIYKHSQSHQPLTVQLVCIEPVCTDGNKNPSPDNSQVKEYYCKQSKYDFQELGTEKDRVSVSIWIDDKLDQSWNTSLREAVQAINEAAPGLSLSISEDKKQAIIHVLTIDKEEPYTEVEGNILMRSKAENFSTKIRLGKWKDDGKKGVCIHELFHALGFHHDKRHYAIADPDVYHFDSGKKIIIDKNQLGFIRWDSSTTTMYPCEKKCRGLSKDHLCTWVLEAYPTKVNTDLDEHDMVGLNLVYPPCIDKIDDNVRYRPNLGRNGMYYCGREVMIDRTYPNQEYTRFCGPDKGPNCPACRTIKSEKVEEILAGGRWQGMTGRVYCGRPFTEPAKLSKMHDGICGIDDGPACPDCNNILNKEHVQSASRPRTSV